MSTKLALLGGSPVVLQENHDLFQWPIVTREDENAVLEVLRSGTMSSVTITRDFEREWGEYQGTSFNLAHCNGTNALLSAMFAVGLGRGDEVIVPSITYWASALGAHLLGATPVFAEIDPVTLCIDPADIARRIGPRTKAILVVHYCGHPCDMDPIMALAQQHRLKVIEDVSHAHGTLYKGRMCGSLGHIAGMSMMAGKSFAVGEGGMLCTNDRELYERAIAFCHYERCATDLTDESLRAMTILKGSGHALPLAGLKGRINQTCSAMGRVQLKYYPERITQIQGALNRFWDLLEGVPGVRPHRPTEKSGFTMGGWYNPVGHYLPEELGGLSVSRFVEAVNAEGGQSGRGVNLPLHLHPVFNEVDLHGDCKPTRIAFSDHDVRQPSGSLPVSEALSQRALGLPWFKFDRPADIAQYAAAWRKVAENADQLQ